MLAELIKLIIAVVLLAASGFVILANYIGIYRWWHTREHYSHIPLLGGLLGMAGLLIYPKFRMWAWVPLILDTGSVPLLVGVFVGFLRRKRTKQ